MTDTTLETKTETKPMKRSVWPLAGVAFVVILLIGSFAGPPPPQPGDPVEEIRSHYVDHATGVQIYVYASALSAVFFLLFVVSVQQAVLRLGEAYREAASAVAGAGLLVLAATLAGVAPGGVLSFEASSAGDDTVRALFALGDMTLNVGDFMLTVVVGVPSLVALGTRLLPRWIAWLGVVLALAWAVAAVSIFAETGPMAGANGPYGFSVVLVFLVWVTATSIALFRGQPRMSRS